MMEYRGYVGKVEGDGDEFYGTVVNLHRDHVDFRGKMIDEVRQAFHDSVDFHLVGCAKDDEEPEKSFSGKFVVRLPPATHRRATTLARMKDQSLNAVVAKAVEEYLSAQGV